MTHDITQIKRGALAVETLTNMQRYRRENNYVDYSHALTAYEHIKARISDKTTLGILGELEKKVMKNV